MNKELETMLAGARNGLESGQVRFALMRLTDAVEFLARSGMKPDPLPQELVDVIERRIRCASCGSTYPLHYDEPIRLVCKVCGKNPAKVQTVGNVVPTPAEAQQRVLDDLGKSFNGGPEDFGGEDAPHAPAAEKLRNRAGMDVINNLPPMDSPNPDSVRADIALPTFAELQEGDWVRLRVVADGCSKPEAGWLAREGYIERVEPPPPGKRYVYLVSEGYNVTCREGSWTVVAFKPLRQVVEELAREHSANMFIKKRAGGTEVAMGVGPSLGSIRIFDSDERTALLAAKAALEVMIARKKESP